MNDDLKIGNNLDAARYNLDRSIRILQASNRNVNFSIFLLILAIIIDLLTLTLRSL